MTMEMEKSPFLTGDTSTHSWVVFSSQSFVSFAGEYVISETSWLLLVTL